MSIKDPFSINHLPYGVVKYPGGETHLSVRFENQAVSLEALRKAQLLPIKGLTREATVGYHINSLAELEIGALTELRARLQEILKKEEHRNLEGATLPLAPYPKDDPNVLNPIKATDFVDFYSSRHHAFRVGCLFRGPENALPEQYFHLPIGYHGRSSTLFCSGTEVRRPNGILSGPTFGPTQRLDYELEVGFVLRGRRGYVSPDDAWNGIFGVVLVNDWSARDIQAFEYKPLGPFLGKSFATTVGSWVTPLEALNEWRRPNEDSDHQVLPHLAEKEPHHLDLPLQASLEAGGTEVVLCRSNLSNLAWSAAQMVAHMSSNNTVISAGDLIATGTVSGPDKGARACLLERTEGGKEPVSVGTEERTFLEDGDTVVLTGGRAGLGLAPCRGTIIS